MFHSSFNIIILILDMESENFFPLILHYGMQFQNWKLFKNTRNNFLKNSQSNNLNTTTLLSRKSILTAVQNNNNIPEGAQTPSLYLKSIFFFFCCTATSTWPCADILHDEVSRWL